jgi:hypothetical protein
MTTKLSIDRSARLAGILLGVGLAAVALVAWRVPRGERTLGADVRMEALQTGPVGVAPLQPFLAKPSLLPGAAVSGSVTLRNQTGVPLALRLRALPSTRDLNRMLVVKVSAGARALYDGSLEGLRTSGTGPLRLRSGQAQRVQVRASLPASLKSGYQGRIVDITLQIDSRTAR